MTIYLNDQMIQEERLKDMCREAQHYRLIKQATAKTEQPAKGYHVLLSRLGGLFINWGCRLQDRYGSILGTPNEYQVVSSFGEGRLTADTSTKATPCAG